MTQEELLIPRYEVIADYPFQLYSKGSIIIGDEDYLISGEGEYPKQKMSEFPALFRPLQWWEKRKVEDMPEYVKSLADDKGDIFKIEEWDMELLIGWIDKQERSVCSLLTFKPEYGYIPATEQQYIDCQKTITP